MSELLPPKGWPRCRLRCVMNSIYEDTREDNYIMGFFWRLGISQSLADASARAEQGYMTAEEARARVLDLETRVSKLTLVNHALFELVSERTGITEAELIDRVNEIDLRDGTRDGRPRPEPP